ncbi:MAG: four helix bundle protein [bacterium]|nr:four helix bundle protein [bacterium]
MAFHISNEMWNIVKNWDVFAKKTIGDQYVRSVDSISVNIAEGFGRKTKKDKIKFYNYAYASTLEALDWNEKAHRRKLLSTSQYDHMLTELKKLPREIHSLSKFTERKLQK